jgi:hypothetical protein
MDTYLNAAPVEQIEVVDLFKKYTLAEMSEHLLWVKVFFDRQDQLHDYLVGLVKSLYKMDYFLYQHPQNTPSRMP